MPALYRVFPYVARARRGRPGHPLHVPRSSGAHRVDNLDRYDTLYAGTHPEGAVAEAFGWLARWDADMLAGAPALPGSVRALATYDLPDDVAVCDLDDARRLVSLRLRPSQVVTRDRAVSQAWAARIFDRGGYAGVRWWSYYVPDWGSVGLWATGGLSVRSVEPLTLDHPAVDAAARAIVRVIA